MATPNQLFRLPAQTDSKWKPIAAFLQLKNESGNTIFNFIFSQSKRLKLLWCSTRSRFLTEKCLLKWTEITPTRGVKKKNYQTVRWNRFLSMISEISSRDPTDHVFENLCLFCSIKLSSLTRRGILPNPSGVIHWFWQIQT